MQLKQTLGRIVSHRPRHHARGVLIMDAPQAHRNKSWTKSQARWSNTDYDDPWPVRA